MEHQWGGGYAALMFANFFNAKRAICFSPQYSIDLDIAKFDPRWMEDRKNLLSYNFMKNHIQLIELNCNVYIFYDKYFSLDNTHIKFIQNNIRISHLNLISLNYSEHSTTKCLQEMSLLKDVVLNIFNIAEFVKLYKKSRDTSATYFTGLSNRLNKFKHFNLALNTSTTTINKIIDTNETNIPCITLAVRCHVHNLLITKNLSKIKDFINQLKSLKIFENIDFSLQMLQLSFIIKDEFEILNSLDNCFHKNLMNKNKYNLLNTIIKSNIINKNTMDKFLNNWKDKIDTNYLKI